MTVLWLGAVSLIKNGTIKQVIQSRLKAEGVPFGSVLFNSLHIKTPEINAGKYANGRMKMPNEIVRKQARKNLDNDIKILKPSLIVINDENTLQVITGEKYTLATVRGSLYYYNGIPCLVCDNYNQIAYKKYGKFVYDLDLEKIGRWATGKQKNEPAFDYIICEKVSEVLAEVEAAKNAVMVGNDTETAGGFITVISYAYVTQGGRIRTFIVPFFDPFAENGAYWKTAEEEKIVRLALKDLSASQVPKIYQNGTYDCAYEIIEGMPPVNYFIDTQNLMHSIWAEAPKRLHNIASYFVDCYTYWKDEAKGSDEDGWGKSPETVRKYWRYNGLDSYYTVLSAVELLSRIVRLPWAIANYNSEFRLSVGPCLAASMRGLKTDKSRHAQIMLKQSALFEEGKEDLRRLTGEANFNVNSPYDVAWLLYDVMGAQKTRLQRKGSKYGVRSTDEKVLSLMKEQRNFFLSNAIDRVLAAKKPGATLSKYGKWYELVWKDGRFHSWHNASATETFRLNSGSWQYWTGTNGQNLQPFIQEMFTADQDYVYVDFDYSASDDWFIAYEAEDETKMEILKTKDTHSYHAATFFKLDYDKVVAGKKKHEEWVVHAIKGVRQISKKFNHGKNFCMQAEMTYNLMGRDMAVATAKLIGYKNAEGMSDKELIGMCQDIGDLYDHPKKGLYKRIRAWQKEIITELKSNDGKATNAFGLTRKFFGSADDPATQRELSAFFGQSGTSGNTNRAVNEIFYSGIDDGKLCLFLLQVHDSLKFLVHKSVLRDTIRKIKSIMEKEIELKGRTFFVPVAVEVGLTDGKQMLPWRSDLTYEEIVTHEHSVYDKKFPPMNTAEEIIASLTNMNFDEETLDKELAERFGDLPEDMSNNDDERELVE